MDPWTPQTILGPYVLLEPIGAGGMGEVWKARDTRLDRTVAIKRLKPGHSASFEREARAIAALNHPNVCQIHDAGRDYLGPYLPVLRSSTRWPALARRVNLSETS